MRSVCLSVLLLAPLLAALPIPSMQIAPWTSKDIEILDFNFETAWTKFAIAPGFRNGELASPLVIELVVNPVEDFLTSNITLNQQPLNVSWETSPDIDGFTATVKSPANQVLAIKDERGVSHSVDVSIFGFITPDTSDTQHVVLNFMSVDDLAVKHFDLNIRSRPNSTDERIAKIYRTSDMTPGDVSLGNPYAYTTTETVLNANPFEEYITRGDDGDHEFDIEAELESLLLLEAEAGDLNAKVAAKKKAIAQCLKDHRDQATLRHLLSQCDSVVCAAKVIAQRICDKMGVLTEPNLHYVQVQNPQSEHLIEINDENHANTQAAKLAEMHHNSSLSTSRYFAVHTNEANVKLYYPQSMLYKVLGIIATAFGLTALFSFVRRKCMSARKKVDRLAAQEERRNARAYRRAARRADMRRRWDAFLTAVSCFRADEAPRIEDYEEKRALILQDAFLEQDLEAAEKGEVMEAEIRELRNAHQIVSCLVGVDENRHDLMSPPVRDPPPSMVPLPYRQGERSRASTATLPSYTSESLPDYRSRVSVDVLTRTSRSSSLVGSTVYSPTTASIDEVFTHTNTGSTPRSFSPEGSQGSRRSQVSHGSRRSRYTSNSSVIDVSTRCSEETLRTADYRRSLNYSRRSRDTNDL